VLKTKNPPHKGTGITRGTTQFSQFSAHLIPKADNESCDWLPR